MPRLHLRHPGETAAEKSRKASFDSGRHHVFTRSHVGQLTIQGQSREQTYWQGTDRYVSRESPASRVSAQASDDRQQTVQSTQLARCAVSLPMP
mmetsp:Transcript_7158/g.21841  ORF Transcript_7158/g.21841 Transcript_7158/m.21841 type:complete len:94 (+) Transcript_7158:815-1096(+)